MQIIRTCEQGTDEWFQLRLGSIGGSSITHILGGGRGREKLMNQLLDEIITGQNAESYQNANMRRGTEYEPKARLYYELITGNIVEEVALITNDVKGVHYSPDGLIGNDGLLEIKTRLPHVFLEKIDSGKIEIGYIRQVQHGLWVTERQYCDFMNYCPEAKDPMHLTRIERDEKMIREIKVEVRLFLEELNAKVERLR